MLNADRGRGNSIMVSVFFCQAGCPGLSLVLSVCFRKVEFCQDVINMSPLVPPTGSVKAMPRVIMSVIMHVKDP